MEMYRRTYAEINLDHLAYNIQLIQKAFPQASFLCPMIKANAYGHGDVEVAQFLEKMGIKYLGVCLIEEGLRLRSFGIKTEILIFRGFDLVGAKKIVDSKMTAVVSSWDQLDYLEAVAELSPTSQVSIHLKFDTGMNRLGFNQDEAQKLCDRLWQNKKIQLKALVTHLFNGEDAFQDQGCSAEQLRKFHAISAVFEKFSIFSHALNSAGILSYMRAEKEGLALDKHPLLLKNWGLRPGLMIYGYSPLDNKEFIKLKPVMSLKSQASVYRGIGIGETVSYGGTWRAQRESIIAVVPIGYADGYHRILSNLAVALFVGKKVQVVGNICMDYLMLDVTDVVRGQDLDSFKDAEVVLFGQSSFGTFLSVEEIARDAQTITWEILTNVGERVPRVFTGAQINFGNSDVGGLT